MTDTTGTITYPPLERYEYTFVVPANQPDPRDAFIAEQEARYFKLEQELNGANARIWQLEAAGRNMIATARGLNDLCVEHERRAEVAQARIAQLEARIAGIEAVLPAWKASDIATTLAQNCYFGYGTALLNYVDALMPSPEGDMRETVEELDA